MRILQFIETGGPGGAETVFVRLARALVAAGDSVTTIVGSDEWLAAELRASGVAVSVYRAKGALDTGLLAFLRAEYDRFKPDVVHAHLFDGAIYAATVARLAAVPAVVTLHGQHDVRDRGVKLAVKRAILRHTAHAVVVVSSALSEYVRPLLKLREGQLRTIANGVEVAELEPCGPMTDGPVRLVAVGNIRAPKDYATMIRAVALLRTSHPGLRLEIAGQPDRHGLFEMLQSLVTELAVEDVVEFRGFVPDTSGFLRGAACYLLSSTREGFSLSTIEAMLAGVPVVATRSGGPQEIITDGETGLLVPCEDPSALASSVARILDDPHLADTLSRRARAHAGARFSLTTMVEEYRSLYDAAMCA